MTIRWTKQFKKGLEMGYRKKQEEEQEKVVVHKFAKDYLPTETVVLNSAGFITVKKEKDFVKSQEKYILAKAHFELGSDGKTKQYYLRPESVPEMVFMSPDQENEKSRTYVYDHMVSRVLAYGEETFKGMNAWKLDQEKTAEDYEQEKML